MHIVTMNKLDSFLVLRMAVAMAVLWIGGEDVKGRERIDLKSGLGGTRWGPRRHFLAHSFPFPINVPVCAHTHTYTHTHTHVSLMTRMVLAVVVTGYSYNSGHNNKRFPPRMKYWVPRAQRLRDSTFGSLWSCTHSALFGNLPCYVLHSTFPKSQGRAVGPSCLRLWLGSV